MKSDVADLDKISSKSVVSSPYFARSLSLAVSLVKM